MSKLNKKRYVQKCDVYPNKTKRNKEQCRRTKALLIQNFGQVCMLCGKNVGKEITHHHQVPKYAGGSDCYENGCLLCRECHNLIHRYKYEEMEYTKLNEKIEKVKRGNRN